MMCTQDLVFHGAARAAGSGHSVGITDAGGSGSGASVGLLPSPLIHPARAAGSGHRVGITDAGGSGSGASSGSLPCAVD